MLETAEPMPISHFQSPETGRNFRRAASDLSWRQKKGNAFQRPPQPLQRQTNALFEMPEELPVSTDIFSSVLEEPLSPVRASDIRVESEPQYPSPFPLDPLLEPTPLKSQQQQHHHQLQMACMDSESLLHNSCKLYATTVSIVQSALELDPTAIDRPIAMVCKSSKSGNTNSSPRFSYPLNIGLRYGASADVVQLLVSAAPHVVHQPDGPLAQGSLQIALHMDASQDVLELLVSSSSSSSSSSNHIMRDRHDNTPIHTALLCGTSLDTLTWLVVRYTAALNMRNFHGHRPLEVAQHRTWIAEEILNFVEEQTRYYWERQQEDV